ncbi:MAG: DNA-directed RNA polymerase subunit beta [Gammaproteobacteria bacterium]|nr:DNA-directed RNA polymerase subunit beta [Gammaproteobacteria bacterium]
MPYSFTEKKRIRKDFGRLSEPLEFPNLLAIQTESYRRFLQADVAPALREDVGLQAAFNSVFPINAINQAASLNFVSYHMEPPEYDVKECVVRGITYCAPLHVTLQRVDWDNSKDPTSPDARKVIEQTVYLGNIPLMTDTGTFVVNGIERVVVSQIHRSPGVIFIDDGGKVHSSGRKLYSARVIPARGVWVDFEFGMEPRETTELIYVRIDRKKKIHITHLLRAMEFSDEDILSIFYDVNTYKLQKNGKIILDLFPERLLGETSSIDIRDAKGNVLVNEGERISERHVKRMLDANLKKLEVPRSYLVDQITATTFVNTETDEPFMHCNHVLSEEDIDNLMEAGVDVLETLHVNELNNGPYIADTIRRDPDYERNNGRIRSLVEIYNVMRPGEPVSADSATQLFNNSFFNAERYDLSPVGRMKINRQLGWRNHEVLIGQTLNESIKDPQTRRAIYRKGDVIDEKLADYLVEHDIASIRIATPEYPDHYYHGLILTNDLLDKQGKALFSKGQFLGTIEIDVLHEEDIREIEINVPNPDTRVLTHADMVHVLRKLVATRDQRRETDDVDNLSNRRVRSVGETAETAFRSGLMRVQRVVRDRLAIAETDGLMPQDMINAKPIAAAINDFFGSYELSQYMEHNNPLSEVTHKRKISALGPGGLNRENAGFEVRDVHPTHYGRVCPIETPEGGNIGLINSLATFAKINQYGFIETPYREVRNGKVTNKVVYLSSIAEEQFHIAQANALLNENNEFAEMRVNCRYRGEFLQTPPETIDYMDVSPKQIVSITSALIPFLEHVEANRGLMGSNQQRQAVPNIKPEAPLVGTGMERVIARDSGVCVIAKRDGVVEMVDGTRIVVRATGGARDVIEDDVDIYALKKFTRSNNSTCINQKPTVKLHDRVKEGDVLADGPSVDLGELALGHNIRVAFMPWNGYNYEDSILVSERVVQEDRFTTIHIQKFDCTARETKMGLEEITADIPGIGDAPLTKLDGNGIVTIGAEVKGDDILVGKVTPKGETQLTPEEKLLRAIFGEKASDVKDTSLRLPKGVSGTVVDVQVFTRDDVEKDDRAQAIRENELASFKKDLADQFEIIKNAKFERLASILKGLKVLSNAAGLSKGDAITTAYLNDLPHDDWLGIRTDDDDANRLLDQVAADLEALDKQHRTDIKNKRKKLERGDDLRPSVLKEVHVYIATKRRIQAGDKMAGRHGNKGVISVIMPVEDMPFDEHGEPVDIVLNPLGVPTRMNVGQLLEAHIGWAAKGIGLQIGRMLDHQKETAELRQYLDKVYNTIGDKPVDLDSLNERELLELAGNLREGVPIATPVFDGAREDDIKGMLELAGLPTSGQTTLYDGRTGEAFDRPITVGYLYLLKLNHLVDDKMHARSTGSYSMVTQQPLGGKAQFGGQRFGEMEVWALEAYGAAYALQEMLTVKSDDVEGRGRMYQDIVNRNYGMKPNIPESFNVIRKEIRSLALDVDFGTDV